MGIPNTSVNGRVANATVKAPMPGPMGINTSVNLRMMTYTVLTEDGKPAINQGFVCYA